jgi:hypothetical protein
MSAILDPKPIPAYAVSMWADENNAYMAIPMKGKSPFITKFPLTAAGLGEALAKMRNYHAPIPPKPVYTPPPQLTARVIARSPLSNDRRLALATDILSRLMITPKR